MNGDALYSYISIYSNELSIHLSEGVVHIYSLPDADWLMPIGSYTRQKSI